MWLIQKKIVYASRNYMHTNCKTLQYALNDKAIVT